MPLGIFGLIKSVEVSHIHTTYATLFVFPPTPSVQILTLASSSLLPPHTLPFFSLQARTHYQNGQYALAHASASEAKKYNMLAIGIGIALLLVVTLLTLVTVIPVIIIVANRPHFMN